MKQVLNYLSQAFKKFGSDRGPLLASALIQATVFSLFPLMLGLISFSLFILGSSDAVLDKILPLLKQAFPVGLDEIIRSITAIKRTSVVVGILGMFGFFWGAANIFRTLESTLNVIWKIKKDRPFFRRGLLVVGSAFIVFILLILSVAATILMDTLGKVGITQFMGKYSVVFSVLLSIVLFSLIYWRFPNCQVEFKSAIIGAIFTGVFWELAKQFFIFYIAHVDFSQIYGPLSVFFLLFLYLTYATYIFIFGAELTFVIAHRYGEKRSE